MANTLTDKQRATLNAIKEKSEDVLMLCKDAEAGKITGEQFEERVSKLRVSIFGGGRG